MEWFYKIYRKNLDTVILMSFRILRGSNGWPYQQSLIVPVLQLLREEALVQAIRAQQEQVPGWVGPKARHRQPTGVTLQAGARGKTLRTKPSTEKKLCRPSWSSSTWKTPRLTKAFLSASLEDTAKLPGNMLLLWLRPKTTTVLHYHQLKNAH